MECLSSGREGLMEKAVDQETLAGDCIVPKKEHGVLAPLISTHDGTFINLLPMPIHSTGLEDAVLITDVDEDSSYNPIILSLLADSASEANTPYAGSGC